MRRMTALSRIALMTAAACLFSVIGRAADQAEIITALDEVDRSISESRNITTRTEGSLEELRKELYRSAVQTRDAKRLSKEIEEALEKGDDVTAELLSLKNDIVSAGLILRDVNTFLKRLSAVNNSTKEELVALSKNVEALKLALVAPADARKAAGSRLVKSLEHDLANANDLAEQRGKIIDRLNEKIIELKESGGVAHDNLNVSSGYIDPDIAKADALLNEGKTEKAIELFGRAIYENPDSDEARLGLAACYFERGDTDISRRMIEEVQNRDKSNTKAMGLMGALYYHQGQLKKAKKLLEKAIRLNEYDARNLNYLGVVQFETGSHEEGIENVGRAVEIDPDYIAARYNLAVMLATADVPDLTAAGIHYRKAIELGSPRDPIMDQMLNLSVAEEVGE